MSVDESQEDQVQHIFMYPQNGIIIDFTVTSESDTISVDNTDNELVSTRAPLETDQPYSQPTTYTSSSSGSAPRNYSTSALSDSNALPSALKLSSKSHNWI